MPTLEQRQQEKATEAARVAEAAVAQNAAFAQENINRISNEIAVLKEYQKKSTKIQSSSEKLTGMSKAQLRAELMALYPGQFIKDDKILFFQIDQKIKELTKESEAYAAGNVEQTKQQANDPLLEEKIQLKEIADVVRGEEDDYLESEDTFGTSSEELRKFKAREPKSQKVESGFRRDVVEDGKTDFDVVKANIHTLLAKDPTGGSLSDKYKQKYSSIIAEEKELIARKSPAVRPTETIIAEREAMFKAIAQGKLLPEGAAFTVKRDNRENLVNVATFALPPQTSGSLDYDAAIRNLDRARDAARGIDSKWIAADAANGQPMAIYLSDARNAVSAAEEQDTFENWASMGLSYFRLAEKMIEMEIKKVNAKAVSAEFNELQKTKLIADLTIARSTVQQGARDLLKGIQSAANTATPKDKKTTQRDAARDAAENYMFDAVSNTLVPFLSDTLTRAQNTKKPGELPEGDNKKARLKTLREDMAVLRDFGTLNREPFTQVTINNAVGFDAQSGVYTVRTDVPLYDLTSKQRDEFIAILNRDTLFRGEELPQWYSEQPQIIQDLIHEYTPAILAGRDLPTQMFKYIPTLRNAAEVRCYSNTLGKLNEYFSGYRSGNMGNDIKQEPTITAGRFYGETVKAQSIDRDTAISATAETIKQMRYLTGLNESDHLYLNSVVDLHSLGKVNARNKEAIGQQTNVHYGNMTINMERYAQGLTGSVAGVNRDLTAAEAMCTEMDSVMQDAQTRDTSPAIQRIIVQLAWVREEYDELVAQTQTTFDPENTNAHLTAKVEQMASLIKQYYQETGQDKKIASVPFCKSGKDRAGVVQIITQSEAEAKSAVLERFILSETKQSLETNLHNQVTLLETDLSNQFALAEETLAISNDSMTPAHDLIDLYSRLIVAQTENVRAATFLCDKDKQKLTTAEKDLLAITDPIAQKKQENTIAEMKESIRTQEMDIQKMNPPLLYIQKKQTMLQEHLIAAENITQELNVIREEIAAIQERNQPPFYLLNEDKTKLNTLDNELQEAETALDEKQGIIDDLVATDFAENSATLWKEIADELKYTTEEVNWSAVFYADGTPQPKDANLLIHLAHAIKNPEQAPLSKENKQKLEECLNNIALKKIALTTENTTVLAKIVTTIISPSSNKKSVIEQICPTEETKMGYTHFIQQSAANQITGGHNGRISSNQTIGSEGIKNDGDILPPSLFAEEKTLVEKVTRRTAKFNSKLKKQEKIVKPAISFKLTPSNNVNAEVDRKTETERESHQIDSKNNSQAKQPAPGFSFAGMLKAIVAGAARIANFLNPMNWFAGNKSEDNDDEEEEEEGMRLSQRKTLVAKHSGGSNVDAILLAGMHHDNTHILNVQELLKQKDELIAAHHQAAGNVEHPQYTNNVEADSNAEKEALLSEITIVNRLKEVHDQLDKILHADHPKEHKVQIVQVIQQHNEKLKEEHGHNDTSPLLFKHEAVQSVNKDVSRIEDADRMSNLSSRSSLSNGN